jgi:predicted RNA binding protein YcfA (HicA-like mRNA interferase family)
MARDFHAERRDGWGRALRASEIIRILLADGWFEVKRSGSHIHYRHAIKRGLVIVPYDSGKDLGKLAHSIFKQAGLR